MKRLLILHILLLFFSCNVVGQRKSNNIREHLYYNNVFISPNLWGGITAFMVGNTILIPIIQNICCLTYDNFNYSIKDNGHKIDYKKYPGFFGFKKCYSGLGFAGQFGYDNPYSLLGPFITVKYQYQYFETKFPNDIEYTGHNLHKLCPGLGTRIRPFSNENHLIKPLFEIGLYDNIIISYKGIYGKEKKQINNGFSSNYKIGIKFSYIFTLLFYYEKNNFDLFNKNFTNNNIDYPFYNVESKGWSYGLTFTTLVWN